MLTTAPRPRTAAAMPRPMSSPLVFRLAEALGRGAAAGVGAGDVGAAAAGRLNVAAVFDGGRGGGGATLLAEGADEAGGRGALAATPDAADGAPGAAGAAGPPEGIAGSLMVGEDAGFGGRLIRTVSFFGCTFAASGGLGGMAPSGEFGLFSDITVAVLPRRGSRRSAGQTLEGLKLKARARNCQTLTRPAHAKMWSKE